MIIHKTKTARVSLRNPWFSVGVVLLGWMAVIVAADGQIPLPRAVPTGSPATSAETNAALAGGPGVSTETLEARLVEARANLAAFGEAGLTNAPPGVSQQDFGMRRALLYRLVRLYEQQLSNRAELEAIRTRKTELVREAQAWTRFAESPPYSIFLTDRLRQEIQAERQKISNGESAATTLDQLIEENRGLLKQAEEKLRQINEQLETAIEPAVVARLSQQRELERLRSQLAAASVAQFHSERLLRQEALDESRIRLGLLERQGLIADAGAKFTQADLDQATNQIDREREQMERELADAQARRVDALRASEAARAELRQAQGSAGGGPVPFRAVELVAAREAQMQAADTAIYVLRLMLEGASIERTMWELRFAAYDSHSLETLGDSERRLGAFNRRLYLWRGYARQQLEVSSSQLQLQETRLNNLAPGSDLLPLARERLMALRESDQFLLRFNRAIERAERLTQRWVEGLRAAEGNLPLTGRVRNVFSDASSFLRRLWTFELFTAEDTITVDGQKITGKRSVTVGKIVMAVFILVAGIWITGLISRIVEPIIVKRLKIETNQAVLIRRWLRALMVASLVLFSLVSVKIPLTVFAFAGGALAIGLGFGTQTMLKNLVSGLILLFERPFRVGDVLDVAGQKGTVTNIGLRASVLQLWDGTETLIPNSSLLENNVTNWTYSDRKVRFIVTVGVAYGTDPRRVTQILNEVAERHGLVEKDPKPQVLFTAFGDSTLSFDLRFWVDVTKANSAQISSDLRLMIAGAFAENGIVIDFPQRDIHLHAASPIQVQVVPPPGDGRASDLGLPNQAKASNNSGEML
jgi:small-conductance mechanosensitive channel